MKFTINRDILTMARESRGYSQEELANKASIPQTRLHRYEIGTSQVDQDDLASIAWALKYPEPLFLLPGHVYERTSSGVFHRKKANILKSELKVIHARLNLFRLQVSRLLQSVDLQREFAFPSYSPFDFSGDIEEIARQVRRDWQISPGPIDNLTEIVEASGGIIFMTEFDTDKIDAVSQHIPDANIPPLFFMNAEKSGERMRWTLAHEIGHVIMHSFPTDDPETEADRFASEFLMPASDISGSLMMRASISSLLQLKPRWKVSLSALARRSHQLGKISDRQYRSLFEQMNAAGIRRKEPLPVPVEEPTLLLDLVRVHLEDLHMNFTELSRTIFLYEDEMAYVYSFLGDSDDEIIKSQFQRNLPTYFEQPNKTSSTFDQSGLEKTNTK